MSPKTRQTVCVDLYGCGERAPPKQMAGRSLSGLLGGGLEGMRLMQEGGEQLNMKMCPAEHRIWVSPATAPQYTLAKAKHSHWNDSAGGHTDFFLWDEST